MAARWSPSPVTACWPAGRPRTGGGAAVGAHRLWLRMGVGAGEVVALNVGGVAGSWRLLLSGAPVIQTSLAEQQAARGEVVLSPEAWMLAGPGWAGEPRARRWVWVA